MALTTATDTPARSGDARTFPVAAATIIYAGSLVAINSAGELLPAGGDDLRVWGRASETVDNSDGLAGDASCEAMRGVYFFKNDPGAGVLGKQHELSPCYALDDETVTADLGTNSFAGIVLEVADDGVWVDTREAGVLQSVAGA